MTSPWPPCPGEVWAAAADAPKARITADVQAKAARREWDGPDKKELPSVSPYPAGYRYMAGYRCVGGGCLRSGTISSAKSRQALRRLGGGREKGALLGRDELHGHA